MLALQKTGLRPGLVLEEAAEPQELQSGEALIKVSACGICGSDVHAYKLDADYSFMAPYLPLTMGHEFSGKIVATKNAGHVEIGQRVTVIPSIGCGMCRSCLLGQERDCKQGTFLGYTRPGGFAEYVVVPARNCIPLPDNVDDELAALCEPLCIGAEAVITGEIGIGHCVVVLGAGAIGQAAALMAREAGASRVVVAGYDDASRFATFRQLGFEELIDVATNPLLEQASFADGADCVVEATGSAKSLEQAIPVLKKGGILVAAGIYSDQARVDLTAMVRSRIQIRATYRSETSTWFRVLAMLSSAPEKYRPMITHRLKLADAEQGFELALSREASKVLLLP